MKKITAMIFVSLFAISCAHKNKDGSSCGAHAGHTEGHKCACGKDKAACTCGDKTAK